jgi:Arylsulfotransferase (ASST)/Arylsulfotransferase Ig-like domain
VRKFSWIPASLYLFLAYFIIAANNSCKKNDLDPLAKKIIIDSIVFSNFPHVKFSLEENANIFMVKNQGLLPYIDSNSNITFKLYAKNLKSLYHNNTNLIQETNTENEYYNLSIPSTSRAFLLEGIDGSRAQLSLNFTSLQYPAPTFKKLELSINPNNITPLAGLVNFESDQKVSFTYRIKGQDGEDFIHSNDTLKINGSDKIFALYPNYKNEITFTIKNSEGSTKDTTLFIPTTSLPNFVINQNTIKLNKLNKVNSKVNFIVFCPFKTENSPFNSPEGGGAPVIIDRYGKIRGYLDLTYILDIKLLPNGHYLYCNPVGNFYEIDLVGNIYNVTPPPSNCHHDFDLLSNGNIIYTGQNEAAQGTVEDKIYEIDYKTGKIINSIDLYNILDPERQQLPDMGKADWFHNNSLCYDKTDNSIVISGRSQSTIAKISLTTKKLMWMISDPYGWKPGYQSLLLDPIGKPFEYAYGMHSVRINPINHNQLMVFDNGNFRSYSNPMAPKDSYTRLVEYSVDPNNRTVSQSFEFGKQFGSENFTAALSNVDYVTPNNMFICYGLILKENNNSNVATDQGIPSIRFIEVDRNGNINLDISVKNPDVNKPMSGIRTYRGHPFSFF